MNICDLGLGKASNLNDVDCINQGPFGAWIGWGRGPRVVEKWNDNHIKNLIWFKMGEIIKVCNYWALINVERGILKIPTFQINISKLTLKFYI